MKGYQRFPAPRTKRPNIERFATEKLLSTKYCNRKHHHRIMKQSQRKRSRISLLLALVSILSTLLVLANFFLAPTAANTSYYNIEETFTTNNRERYSSEPLEDKRKQRTLQYHHRSEDRYNREITVVEYTDIFSVRVDHETSQQNAKASEWSPEQIQEMEKYYTRYLEVFHQQHGYDYEPEDKEVVYREYLSFRERKQKEIKERKQAAAKEKEQSEAAQKKRAIELRQQRYTAKALATSSNKEQSSKGKEESNRKNETVRNHNDGNPIETPHRVVADQIMVKPAPYTLELDLADIEQQATKDLNGGSLLNNKNYTEQMTIVTGASSSTPATAIAIR